MKKNSKQKPNLVVHVLRALRLRVAIPVLRLAVAALRLTVPTLRPPKRLGLRLRLETAVSIRIVVVRGARHAASIKTVAAAVVRAALPPRYIIPVVVRVPHVAGPVVVPEIAPRLVEVALGLS